MKKIVFFVFLGLISSTITFAQPPHSGVVHESIQPFRVRPIWSSTHPELRPGEIFLTNISTETYTVDNGKVSLREVKDPTNSLMVNFKSLHCKTKRTGKIAYDFEGKILSGSVPVFIKKAEMDSIYSSPSGYIFGIFEVQK